MPGLSALFSACTSTDDYSVVSVRDFLCLLIWSERDENAKHNCIPLQLVYIYIGKTPRVQRECLKAVECGERGERGEREGRLSRIRRYVLVFCNVTNKICKRTDTAVAFNQEYSRVSYPLRNVSTLSTGLGSSNATR